MDGSDAARGRLTIRHDLIKDKRGLFCACRKASLPGKFGNEISDSVMSTGV